MKKVTIYIDDEKSFFSEDKESDRWWNKLFIQNIIDTELDGLSGFGYVMGYTIEDITKEH